MSRKKTSFIWASVIAGMLLFSTTSHAQLAQGAGKFLGNITTNGQVRSDFGTYWNQITGENEHKWSSVEGTRDSMNWGGADAIADFARENDMPWKFHTLVWGSQYPSWMDGLSTEEQRAEIIEWFDAAADRYPDVQMIDVVNEAYMSDPNDWDAGKHAPIPFRDALGGIGSTGFDWIVESFKMARERWPNAILIYNDYNTLEWPNEIDWIKEIIPRLVEAGAPIDAVGFQAHGLKGTSADVLKSRLDDIYETIQLPMLISEYDIGDNDDQVQLENYEAHIPVMWNHPGVAGITIWGYILGSTWVEGTGLIRDGQERPALTWLRDYINDNPNPPNDYPDFLNGGVSSCRLAIATRGLGSVSHSPDESSYAKDSQVTLTASPFDGWVFDSWSGDADGNQNPLTITMDAAKSVTANFVTEDGTRDLIVNGTFSSGADSWNFNNWNGDGEGIVADGEYQLTVNTVGENYYDIQVVQPGILLEQNKAYRVVFDAYTSSDRVLNVNVGMPEDPYTSFLTSVEGETEVDLTTSKQTFSFEFIMEEPTYDDSRIEFSVGTDTPAVYIDNISMIEVEPTTAFSAPKFRSRLGNLTIRKSADVITAVLHGTCNGKTSLQVYNLKGNLVESKDFRMEKGRRICNLNTSRMPKGYYIMKLQNGNDVMKSKLLIAGE
ncbi:MAG: endo-1,4-beta-xylanase [Chitinispirillaceae bacterium]